MVAGRLSAMRRGVKVALRERENTVKKMITAAIGGALLSGAMLGAGRPVPSAVCTGKYSTCSEAAEDAVFNIPRATRTTGMAEIATATASPARRGNAPRVRPNTAEN